MSLQNELLGRDCLIPLLRPVPGLEKPKNSNDWPGVSAAPERPIPVLVDGEPEESNFLLAAVAELNPAIITNATSPKKRGPVRSHRPAGRR